MYTFLGFSFLFLFSFNQHTNGNMATEFGMIFSGSMDVL